MYHINSHLTANNILHTNHHGGRKAHPTTTALTAIYDKILYTKENSIISVILCTDLSAVYDTVDTDILLRKLEHYGFRGKMHSILQSYFGDRKQYVCLETFN